MLTVGSLRSTNEAPSENVEFYQQDGSIETPLKGPNRSNQSFSLKILLVLISQSGSHNEDEDEGNDDNITYMDHEEILPKKCLTIFLRHKVTKSPNRRICITGLCLLWKMAK